MKIIVSAWKLETWAFLMVVVGGEIRCLMALSACIPTRGHENFRNLCVCYLLVTCSAKIDLVDGMVNLERS